MSLFPGIHIDWRNWSRHAQLSDGTDCRAARGEATELWSITVIAQYQQAAAGAVAIAAISNHPGTNRRFFMAFPMAVAVDSGEMRQRSRRQAP